MDTCLSGVIVARRNFFFSLGAGGEDFGWVPRARARAYLGRRRQQRQQRQQRKHPPTPRYYDCTRHHSLSSFWRFTFRSALEGAGRREHNTRPFSPFLRARARARSAHPHPLPSMEASAFEELGLQPELIKAIGDLGWV
jgi:hypothetical protein